MTLGAHLREVEERRRERDGLADLRQPPAGFLAGQLADLGTGHTVQLAEHVLDGLQLVVGEHIKVRGARRHQPVLGPAEEVFLQQFGRPGFDQSLANRQ